jgi:hypothetical protein
MSIPFSFLTLDICTTWIMLRCTHYYTIYSDRAIESLNFLSDETLQVSSALDVDYDGHHSRRTVEGIKAGPRLCVYSIYVYHYDFITPTLKTKEKEEEVDIRMQRIEFYDTLFLIS